MISKAYCFDLDGTLTKTEILPLISKEIGLFEEIDALTEATIKGLIPFDKSFKLRVKLLSEISIEKINEILNYIDLYKEILYFIKNNPKNSYIITGNLDIWINKLILTRIGCNFFSSQGEIRDNKTFLKKIINKANAVEKIRKKHNIIISVGDGMGDVAMLDASDIGIVFGQTHKPIESLIKIADYAVFDEGALCRLLNTL